jgi:hypothetical protein
MIKHIRDGLAEKREPKLGEHLAHLFLQNGLGEGGKIPLAVEQGLQVGP